MFPGPVAAAGPAGRWRSGADAYRRSETAGGTTRAGGSAGDCCPRWAAGDWMCRMTAEVRENT